MIQANKQPASSAHAMTNSTTVMPIWCHDHDMACSQKLTLRIPHCRHTTPTRNVMPTALYEYLRRKVMRKPKPTKIMTCTSWKSG